MDAITSLVGNKLFKTFYDPTADNLAAQYRASSASNLNTLQNSLAKATETKDILSKIPGVSADTQSQMDALLKESSTFTTGATDLSPNTVAAKKDEMNKKMNTLVKQAQDEAAKKKKDEAAAAAAAKKEAMENQKFSFTRLVKRTWDSGKWFLFYAGLIFAALLGGSMSSNAAIHEPWKYRLYYFIYGSLLFPLSFAFAIMRYIKGQGGAYHAILAPLVAEPVSSNWYRYLFYPFIYTPENQLVPLPVEAVVEPQHSTEEEALAEATGAVQYRPRPEAQSDTSATTDATQYRPRPEAAAAALSATGAAVQYRPRPGPVTSATQYRPRPGSPIKEDAAETPGIQYRPRPGSPIKAAVEDAAETPGIQYRPRPGSPIKAAVAETPGIQYRPRPGTATPAPTQFRRPAVKTARQMPVAAEDAAEIPGIQYRPRPDIAMKAPRQIPVAAPVEEVAPTPIRRPAAVKLATPVAAPVEENYVEEVAPTPIRRPAAVKLATPVAAPVEENYVEEVAPTPIRRPAAVKLAAPVAAPVEEEVLPVTKQLFRPRPPV